jgi:hypothetical protein
VETEFTVRLRLLEIELKRSGKRFTKTTPECEYDLERP